VLSRHLSETQGRRGRMYCGWDQDTFRHISSDTCHVTCLRWIASNLSGVVSEAIIKNILHIPYWNINIIFIKFW